MIRSNIFDSSDSIEFWRVSEELAGTLILIRAFNMNFSRDDGKLPVVSDKFVSTSGTWEMVPKHSVNITRNMLSTPQLLEMYTLKTVVSFSIVVGRDNRSWNGVTDSNFVNEPIMPIEPILKVKN